MATMTGPRPLISAPPPEVSTESLGEASADAEAGEGSWVVTEIIVIKRRVCYTGCPQKGSDTQLYKVNILGHSSKLL